MAVFSPRITCCYLHPITRYGYPPPAANTVLYMQEMQRMGFQSIELEGIRRNHLLEVAGLTKRIASEAAKLDLTIPYFCAVLPGLSSPDAAVREQNLRDFETGCALAHALGSVGILDNGPLPPYLFPDEVPVVRHFSEKVLIQASLDAGLNFKTYFRNLAGTYREACSIAAGYGLTYQLHPCLGVLTATTEGFLRFFDAVKADNLRFNFDTANLFAMRENLTLSLHQAFDHIDYIHVSDNTGHKIEHLPLGEGSIHWDRFFNLLHTFSYTGTFGVDIGGAETPVDDLDASYISAATMIQHYLNH